MYNTVHRTSLNLLNNIPFQNYDLKVLSGLNYKNQLYLSNWLLNMLISKKISGAAIDVFSKEPYDGPFIKLNNVVLTPHLGSYAEEGKLQMEIDAVNNLILYLK